ncbi:unnamed protein product [Victoria cruziana]
MKDVESIQFKPSSSELAGLVVTLSREPTAENCDRFYGSVPVRWAGNNGKGAVRKGKAVQRYFKIHLLRSQPVGPHLSRAKIKNGSCTALFEGACDGVP